MWVVRDLSGGPKPSPIELFYNGNDDADSSTKRYKGSLVKICDWDNATGIFCTHAEETTTYEGIIGILAEEQGAADDNYMAEDASYGMRVRKITPTLPSSIIRAEYAQKDPSGSSILDTGASVAAAGATFTTAAMTADDQMIGGWIYFVTGANAGYLHYVKDSASGNDITFATAVANAVVSGDTFICINPPMTLWLDLCDHAVHIESEVDDGSRNFAIVGLMTYFTDDGHEFQRLDRNLHDGLKLSKPRFYHDFLMGGSATIGSVWRDTVLRA
jgi:hypothetical protein